jgi:hypothetical protein
MTYLWNVKHARFALERFRQMELTAIDWPKSTQNSEQTRLSASIWPSD